VSREVVGGARRLYGGNVNASPSTLLRAVQSLGYVALLLTVFEACSGDQASPPTPPAGPATIEISGIALGQGFFGDGGASSTLGCDYTIGVNVQTTNWTLLPPARCGGALQCGQLRVSLLDGSSERERLKVVSAGNGVALDLRSLVSATPPLEAGTYVIKVELVDDAGKTYVAVGGKGTDEQSFDLKLPENCAVPPLNPASGGAGGGSSGAGNAGDTAGADTAGAGGDTAGGDTAGSAGIAGAAGVEGA